ncbi:unnamed protein product [Rangifer tarandus platyrhynchus]|uniref:Uncharacterized protein n=1 Tax=Rangifer tarandus platyrhynchus TaxID=3082113 RepID=A0ABN9A920_RANTA|nr:unnamed protein product [Rangifer tarandus platyrhynchus]
MLLNFGSFFLQRKFSLSHYKEHILLIEIREEKWPKLGSAVGDGIFTGCRRRIGKGDSFILFIRREDFIHCRAHVNSASEKGKLLSPKDKKFLKPCPPFHWML